MDDLSVLTPFELQEHINRLRKSISDFERDARKYKEEVCKRDQKECEKFVGRYFKTSDKYFKIIGVPQFILTMAHTYYEANEFPAIVIEVNGKSFDDIYEDTIYRATIDEEYRQSSPRKIFPYIVAEEITPAEFDEFLNEKVRQATARIAATERLANQ